MFRVGTLLLLVAAVSARPGPTQAEILARWGSAGPDERRHMRVALSRLERARRFSEARPILVQLGERTYTLAGLFEQVLEPALTAPLRPQDARDLGFTELHRAALAGLRALRAAYGPPHPVHTGTLNLMLDYAHRALSAPALALAGRLRLFSETLLNVKALGGRVRPDERTRWLIRTRLVPALLGLAHRAARDTAVRTALADAASLLYLPSILDPRAQERLAPLTRGRESRRILLRAYGHGMLDRMGLVALARSVSARARGDTAFATGAPPLMLELLSDPGLPARERAELLDAADRQLRPLEPFRKTLVDLYAAAFGGPPSTLEEYARRQARLLTRPQGERIYRFLQVVLVQPKRSAAPTVARVVRVDTPFYRPLYERHAAGGRRFIGVLLPAAVVGQADLLGPPSALGEARRDVRLLRRMLRLERISIRVSGAFGEFIELCVALPEDRSEPVPATGARLSHVLDLLEARLARSEEGEERADLIRLLVRMHTPRARTLAAREARTAGAIAALLPLAERGDRPAARKLIGHLTSLSCRGRERALAAALGVGMSEAVRGLCLRADVSVAALAGDALLAKGDITGIRLLLTHRDRYARACGSSLALRVTPLAGTLRAAAEPSQVERIARLCRTAFRKEKSDAWKRYGRWLGDALTKPDEVRAARRRRQSIRVGKQEVAPAQFFRYCIDVLGDERHKRFWPNFPPYVLAPFRPGRGMAPESLREVLDAIEAHLDDPPLREAWRDALVVLACVQYGIEMDSQFLDLAHERLMKLAGKSAPPGARRKPGVYWPIWAAQDR